MFSKSLKYYRLKAGLTKKALAQASGLTPMAIAHYEAGERKPSMDSLLSLAGTLGVSIADLLHRRNSSLAFAHGDLGMTWEEAPTASREKLVTGPGENLLTTEGKNSLPHLR